ncbi:MAG: MOSC domain-containing protein [Planctomycetota bacterium]|nr:MAG: MOSC domain-containing protein [Planctomycetota bacterium]
MNETTGIIRAIAWRPVDGAPMQETDACRVRRNTGLDTENRKPGKRSVTLLSLEAWRDVCRELGAELPWTTRRANFLVEGLDFSAAVGRPVRIGPVRVWIHGESKPCEIMDRQFAGLRRVLAVDMRGGIYGQTLNDGTIRVGDAVVIEPSAPAET